LDGTSRSGGSCLKSLWIVIGLGATTLSACGGQQATAFNCSQNEACNEKPNGVCEATGYCAYPDSSCPSGFKYSQTAGPHAGLCVSPTTDARVDDAPRHADVHATGDAGATDQAAADHATAVEAAVADMVVPVDAGGSDQLAVDMTPDTLPPPPPSTCAEYKAQNPAAVDGAYTLYFNHQQPWSAYCVGMSGSSPAEYLTLVNTGSGENFAQYTAGGARPGTNVVTSYYRVRIDPVTLVVDTSDQTFASSTGALTWSSGSISSLGYAQAADCVAWGSSTGLGNVDLRGTPFQVTTTPVPTLNPAGGIFSLGGFKAAGTATYSASNQVVSLTGGGYCGSIAAAWTDQTNDIPAPALQLVYEPPSTCAEAKLTAASPTDGNYTLYYNHDFTKPWTAYCYQMASATPTEYLPFVNTAGVNYGQYTAGGARPGTNVVTSYTKVRIDPATLLVDTSDQTFASSTGTISWSGGSFTSWGYANAGDCVAVGSSSGVGNIDLRGTPFQVATTPVANNCPNGSGGFYPAFGIFCLNGYMAGGSATYSSGNQVVVLAGGGYCGGIDAPNGLCLVYP
jgi:hypothetical protein